MPYPIGNRPEQRTPIEKAADLRNVEMKCRQEEKKIDLAVQTVLEKISEVGMLPNVYKFSCTVSRISISPSSLSDRINETCAHPVKVRGCIHDDDGIRSEYYLKVDLRSGSTSPSTLSTSSIDTTL